jgi:hypothetical protein
VAIEVLQGELRAQKAFMGSCGYTLIATHFTGSGSAAWSGDEPLDALAFNALYKPDGRRVEVMSSASVDSILDLIVIVDPRLTPKNESNYCGDKPLVSIPA